MPSMLGLALDVCNRVDRPEAGAVVLLEHHAAGSQFAAARVGRPAALRAAITSASAVEATHAFRRAPTSRVSCSAW